MDTRAYVADVQSSYDRVAAEYAGRFVDELIHKPLDRTLLNRFADLVRGQGPVCDLGCGPGQITRYLRMRGVDAFGVDLSPKMVIQAQQLNPALSFEVGNMLALAVEDGAWAGIAAFYSVIHIAREDVPCALQEMARVLKPGGWLLLAVHTGQQKLVHVDEWWGRKVNVDFVFFETAEMAGYLREAGFELVDTVEREPYPDVEYQGPRVYFLAQKPITSCDSPAAA
ncbi:MAG: class I SAM-dependent methyltransferase [Anaerolineae bacterium]|nr:class I SAM-dependent methyltransferase [Anaerolineae bacterium]